MPNSSYSSERLEKHSNPASLKDVDDGVYLCNFIGRSFASDASRSVQPKFSVNVRERDVTSFLTDSERNGLLRAV